MQWVAAPIHRTDWLSGLTAMIRRAGSPLGHPRRCRRGLRAPQKKMATPSPA